jgi:hypothetical protein
VLRQVGFLGVPLIVFPRIGGHAAVAPVFETNPVVFVRARLYRAADYGTRHVAELRRIVVGFNPDLGKGIGAGLIGQQVVDRLVHVDAVERVVVLLLPLAVHERTSRAEVLGVCKAVGLGGDHAWQ